MSRARLPLLDAYALALTGKERLAQDAIYVASDSIVNLMALWREHGLDRILRDGRGAGPAAAA